MLLQKPITYPAVLVFKLQTGEEVIANTVSEDSEHYNIEKPLQTVMGANGPQFAGFMMIADLDKPMPLKKASVVIRTVANPAIEDQYTSITSTIAVPKKPSIIV